MDLEIKHTVEPIKLDTTGFESSMRQLGEQIQAIVGALQPSAANNTSQDNRISLDGKQTDTPRPGLSDINAGQSGSNAQIPLLLNKIDSLISTLRENKTQAETPILTAKQKADEAAQIETAKLQARRSDRANNKEVDDAERDNRSWSRYARGVMLGAGAAATYQAGSFGATAGRASGAANVGAMDYLQFQRNLYNEQVANENSIGQTALLAGGFGAVKLAMKTPTLWGKLGATGLALGATAFGNYAMNKNSEENKAGYELALNADFQNWQLQTYGMSPKSDTVINAGGKVGGLIGKTAFNITELQKEMYTKENIMFSKETPAILMGARRDTIPFNDPKAAVAYSTEVQKNAMLMGTDAQSLNKVVSNYAAYTGTGLQESLKTLIELQRKYGGDQVANTSKMLQIMSTTPLNAMDATRITQEYQYNDAMLQNKVGASLATPMEHFQGEILARLAGVSEQGIEELYSGKVPKEMQARLDEGRKSRNPNTQVDPRYGWLMGAAQQFGMNIDARDVGKIESGTMTKTPTAPDLPIAMASFAENAIKALANITTINAGNITINGNTSSSSFNSQENAPVTKRSPQQTNYQQMIENVKVDPNNTVPDLYVAKHRIHNASTGVGESAQTYAKKPPIIDR